MANVIRNNRDLAQQGVTCRICGQQFENRRALHEHQQAVHGDRGRTLQPFPWQPEEGPLDQSDDANDLFILTEYLINKQDILENHREDTVLRTYNYPLAAPPTDHDIEEQMYDVFRRQERAYKINLSPGYILQTNRTDEDDVTLPYTEQALRYFYPSTNNYILETAMVIKNEDDLKAAIKAIQEINIPEHVKKPSSAYDLKFFTQLKYFVFELPRALGAMSVNLPSYVMKHRYIYTQHEKGRYEVKDKNLCLFYAIAQYQKLARTKKLASLKTCSTEARTLYSRYVTYVLERSLMTRAELELGVFDGVSRDMLPHVEDCFDLAINVMCLSADRTAIATYVSSRRGVDPMYVNEHDGHVNLILDIDKYCGYFSCIVCQRLFKKKYHMQRHLLTCNRKAVKVFTGSFLRQYRTIFEQLSDVGIHCTDRENKWFGVWDLEVRFRKCHEQRKNMTYVAQHVPVCAAVCSNVPGFTEGWVCIHDDEQVLIDKMIDYLYAIRAKMAELALQKWGWILDDLESLMLERVRELESENMSRHLDREIDELLMNEAGAAGASESDSEGEDECSRSRAKGDAYLAMLKRLHVAMTRFINQLPVLSFFGGVYDKNVCKGELAYKLVQEQRQEEAEDAIVAADEELSALFEGESRPYRAGEAAIIKKGNRHITISNEKIKLLDMCHYLAPGVSYDQFVQLFCPGQRKFHPFPYEYFERFEQLNETDLPVYPSKAWFSELRQEDLLHGPYLRWQESGADPASKPLSGEQKFAEIKALWQEKGWTSMRDFLTFYALMDVLPMVSACQAYANIWVASGLNVWRDSLSLPSLANIVLWKSAIAAGDTFPLVSERDKSMYYAQKKNLVAGQSLVFCRRQQAGCTKIGPDSDLVTKAVVGLDCNSLYAYVMRTYAMGINTYVRRSRETNFKPVSNFRQHAMFVWLAHCQRRDNVSIVTKQSNGAEVRIKNFQVDGLAIFWDAVQQKKVCRVYEFYGCFHHRCELENCSIRKRCTARAWAANPKAYERTMQREKVIKSMNYELSVIWECQYHALVAENAELREHRNRFRPSFYTRYPRPVNEETIIEGVRSGLLFGLLVVDVEVRSQFAYLYENFPVMFANMTVNYDDLCDEMRAYVDKNKIKFNPKKLLLSGNKAEKIMISSDYLSWLLLWDHFMVKVHHVDEYCKGYPFKEFMDFVLEKRRAAVLDPTQKNLANTYKLAANCSYGAQLKHRELYEETRYISGSEKARLCINEPRFRSLTSLKDDIYEVNMAPRRIKMTSPIALGLYILNGAKVVCLRFLYEFLYSFVDRTVLCITYSDTDSLYLGIPYSSLEEAVKPEKKAEFNEYMYNRCRQDPDQDNLKFHFMRACCKRCATYDTLVGNIWKSEFEGHTFIGLTSKSYHARNTTTKVQKFSCKGVRKRDILRQGAGKAYMSCLTGKKAHYSCVRGFKVVRNCVMTYTQKKRAFDFLYCKRGIYPPPNDHFTFTLNNIVLNNCKNDDFICLQRAAPELTADYLCIFNVNGVTYYTIRQAFVTILAQQCALWDFENKAKRTNDAFVLQRLYKQMCQRRTACGVNKVKILANIVDAVHDQNDLIRNVLANTNTKLLVNAEENLFLGVGELSDTVSWLMYKDLSGQNRLGLEWQLQRAREQAELMDNT